jgi:hypothetical protein
MIFEYTEKMRDDFKKCIDKNITCYPCAINGESDHYHVEVNVNGKKMLSKDKQTKKPIVYTEKEAFKKIFEYYDYYAKSE